VLKIVRHDCGSGSSAEGNLERVGDRGRCGDDVAHENAGVRRGQGGAGQVRAGQGDIDGGPGVTRVWREGVMVGAPTPPVLRVIESRLPTASYW